MLKVFAILCLGIVLANASTLNREKRQTAEEEQAIKDAEKEIANFIDKIYGGSCFNSDQCMEFISYCHRDNAIQPVGDCRPNWWSWLILGLIVLLIAGSCMGCCLLQCCCLYKCCQAIFDCLCCCCRNKGYSPANRG
eukprot:TRINITY_DN5825_c0_g1_i2.p1 TRINITY_DN5825_c0_g1~~TRINITY_DN5825_c0_g1_i2.p1  ORF type:complete len:151 (-),score=37.48 TRINITY_DN5825_c0_g1_i2:618-1028(-)